MSGTREEMLNRLRALKERTVQNGCTEAEAMTAATLLTKLLDKYNFSQSDLEMPLEAISEEAYYSPRKELGQEFYMMHGIQVYCDIKVWQRKEFVPGKRVLQPVIVLFGRESDVLVARYLIDLVRTAMNSEWKRWDRETVRVKRSSDRRLFERGMCMRISQRLVAMKGARNAEIDTASGKTGQDLVVVKNAVVTEAFAKKGLKLRQVAGKGTSNVNALGHGIQAGDRVALNPGIDGRQARRLT